MKKMIIRRVIGLISNLFGVAVHCSLLTSNAPAAAILLTTEDIDEVRPDINTDLHISKHSKLPISTAFPQLAPSVHQIPENAGQDDVPTELRRRPTTSTSVDSSSDGSWVLVLPPYPGRNDSEIDAIAESSVGDLWTLLRKPDSERVMINSNVTGLIEIEELQHSGRYNAHPNNGNKNTYNNIFCSGTSGDGTTDQSMDINVIGHNTNGSGRQIIGAIRHGGDYVLLQINVNDFKHVGAFIFILLALWCLCNVEAFIIWYLFSRRYRTNNDKICQTGA